jgi:hypothetical protein
MKKLIILAVVLLCLTTCNRNNAKLPESSTAQTAGFIDSTDMTNNFYDNTETYTLPYGKIVVDGEIENPGEVDFSVLPLRSVIVKETLLDSAAGGNRFTGAFRYDGYSLFDILEKRTLKKKNEDEFGQIIDMFVEVENNEGEKTAFSWGEIYYPNNLHKILIATGVSRIVPSSTKELWTIPDKSKIVASVDLITERNISDPVRITVRSFPVSFKVVRGMSPMYSPVMKLFHNQKPCGEISSVPGNVRTETFNTVFYGRGRGIHSTQPFTGVLLKEVLGDYFPAERSCLRTGIMCIAGQDGYRCALSYSEVFNRNDQQEFLLVQSAAGEDGGLFRVFAASDFFSDRAVKSVSEIHMGF